MSRLLDLACRGVAGQSLILALLDGLLLMLGRLAGALLVGVGCWRVGCLVWVLGFWIGGLAACLAAGVAMSTGVGHGTGVFEVVRVFTIRGRSELVQTVAVG